MAGAHNWLKGPANAIADSEFISLGIEWRPTVKVVPERDTRIEVVREFQIERRFGGQTNAADIRQARIGQQL